MKIPKLPPLWQKHLKDEFKKDYFINLIHFLEERKNNHAVIYPKESEIFHAFKKLDLDKIKVVILGQDPYHGEGQAHGLCFSVKKECKIPPSLQNIFKELATDLKTSSPNHGQLDNWISQGVFLLNTVLTVEKEKAGAHRKKGWEQFTDEVIKIINLKGEHIVFILWGASAQEKENMIDTKKHLILKAPHPSPLSCYRGFFGSRPFSKSNFYLKQNQIAEINWVSNT